MGTILIIISISFNLIAFLAIINLYARQNRLKEVEKKQAKILEDMEQSIAAFIIQMQEDNEEFLKKVKDVYTAREITSSKKDVPNEVPVLKVEQTPEVKEQSNSPVLSPLKYMAVNKYKQTTKMDLKANPKDDLLFSNVNKANNIDVTAKKGQPNQGEDVKALLEEIKPMEELPIQDQIRLLKKQGLTNEQIAQKLKIGKTELELMIKFHTST